MASAKLKPRISGTLGARVIILGTVMEVGVVYCQTDNESHPVSGRGATYDRTLAGEIGPILAEIRSIVAHKCKQR